jgi:hypothetical protein
LPPVSLFRTVDVVRRRVALARRRLRRRATVSRRRRRRWHDWGSEAATRGVGHWRRRQGTRGVDRKWRGRRGGGEGRRRGVLPGRGCCSAPRVVTRGRTRRGGCWGSWAGPCGNLTGPWTSTKIQSISINKSENSIALYRFICSQKSRSGRDWF